MIAGTQLAAGGACNATATEVVSGVGVDLRTEPLDGDLTIDDVPFQIERSDEY